MAQLVTSVIDKYHDILLNKSGKFFCLSDKKIGYCLPYFSYKLIGKHCDNLRINFNNVQLKIVN